MRATAVRKSSVLVHAVAACFLAAAHAAAEEARPSGPHAQALRAHEIAAHEIAARELAFARKTAANGDFRLSLSLYQRLLDHEPRNRSLRAEMEAVASMAPLDVRARFARPRREPPVALTEVVRKPVIAHPPAPIGEFGKALRAFESAGLQRAPEAREPAPAHTPSLAAPAAAPRTGASSAALRTPLGVETARIATPSAATSTGKRGEHALTKPAKRALPAPGTGMPLTLRAATGSAAPKAVAARAPQAEAEISSASPHANDSPPRPTNERAADPSITSDLVAQAAPEARPKDDLDRLFDQLLRDPGNIGLNLRYARAAIDAGEPRKALPAYERVLALDAANAEALAGIARVRADLQPDITQVTVSFGSFYESNPRHFRNHSSHTDAGTLAGRATVFDERRIGSLRWRTEGEAFFSWHTRFHDIDYGLVGARSGPVFAVSERVRVHPFIGGGYAWLKGRSFYLEVAGGATFEFDKMLPLHSVSVRAGYNDIGQHISTRDAVFVELAPRLLFPNVGYQGTALWLNPYWRYNGVTGEGEPGLDQRSEPFPARAHQLGLRVDYFMPVTSKLTLGVNAGYEYRHFFEPVFEGGKNRRDHFVTPGAQAILTGLVDDRFGIIFLYSYEHRFSNDGPQVYSNHIAGVRLLWRN